MKDDRISCYFDTKYMTILRIEQILHNFEDQKIADFFNLEQVNFSHDTRQLRPKLVVKLTLVFSLFRHVGLLGISQLNIYLYNFSAQCILQLFTRGFSHLFKLFTRGSGSSLQTMKTCCWYLTKLHRKCL